METIILKPFVHRQQECIGIYFTRQPALNQAVKKITISRWTKTHSCWYTPLDKANYLAITKAFEGLATIDHELLKAYLTKKKDTALPPEVIDVATKAATLKTVAVKENAGRLRAAAPVKTVIIHPINKHVLPALKQHLVLKARSQSTIDTYLGEMSQLLQTIGNNSADHLTVADLKRYFVYCFEKRKLSENTLHSRINALKCYYEQVLGHEKFFWEIPRPKKPFQLPNVLGEKEITNLFKALGNIKHKAILFTAYSAGLRVSEAVSLRMKDIDSDRMQIKIVGAKGKKDRYVGLSPIVLDILRNYIKKTNPRPEIYLFESQVAGTAYSTRSAQKVFQRAKEIAGIRKDVSFHSLRHSFATHLLEKGIDIRFIKDLLGHFDIRTTERYTHVRKDKLINIISPLDDLWIKGDFE